MTNKRTQNIIITCCILFLAVMVIIAAIKLNETISSDAPTTLVYGETEFTNLNGKHVSVTGYMSLTSPYMSDLMYLVSTPVTGYPNEEIDTKIGKALACYSKIGTRFDYTDYPVTVEGTFVVEDIADYQGISYKYYIKDCTVSEFTDDSKVLSYRQSIDGGAISYIDELLQKLTAIIANKEKQELDKATIDEQWRERMGTIQSSELQLMYDNVSNLVDACIAYQDNGFPEEGEVFDKVKEANSEFVEAMSQWVKSYELRGDEHEVK